MRAAVGFSVHTGWAAAVVVDDAHTIVARTRIALAPDDDARFCFHIAAGLPVFGSGAASRTVPIGEAKKIVSVAATRARKSATKALRAWLARFAGVDVAALPPAKVQPALADVLASHARIHAAEGALYVEAIADACATLRLEVVRVARAPALSIASPGPPWGKDQKLAAALAAAALSSRAR